VVSAYISLAFELRYNGCIVLRSFLSGITNIYFLTVYIERNPKFFCFKIFIVFHFKGKFQICLNHVIFLNSNFIYVCSLPVVSAYISLAFELRYNGCIVLRSFLSGITNIYFLYPSNTNMIFFM
jgi:hypothetical protein